MNNQNTNKQSAELVAQEQDLHGMKLVLESHSAAVKTWHMDIMGTTEELSNPGWAEALAELDKKRVARFDALLPTFKRMNAEQQEEFLQVLAERRKAEDVAFYQEWFPSTFKIWERDNKLLGTTNGYDDHEEKEHTEAAL